MMDKVKKELQLMQSYPRLYLANYFQDLKQKVDLAFNQVDKLAEKLKYLEIIAKIEEIEQDYYKTTKPFVQEIESLVKLDDLKYKIEKKLNQNKSILFIEDFGQEKKTFLLILTNAFLRQSTLDHLEYELDYFNRETLIAYFTHKQQFNSNIVELDVLIGLNSLNEINFKENQITKIHSSTFNGLNNLKRICFNNNQITELNPDTFNGLTHLEEIYFENNSIQELDQTLFNGLKSLKEISFSHNQIIKIPESTFKGLTNLKGIWFANNKIEQLDPILFNGLNNLKKISFRQNQIAKIHPYLFNGLTNLEGIYFQKNKIKELDPITFNGLNKLKVINFSCNQLTQIKQFTFNGLSNLEYMWFL